jgi:hypothetical protein
VVSLWFFHHDRKKILFCSIMEATFSVCGWFVAASVTETVLKAH